MQTKLSYNKLNARNLAANIVLSFATIILIMLNENGGYNALLSYFLLLLNAISVFKARNNWYLLIVFASIIYCNYSIVLPNYLINSIDAYYFGYAETPIGTTGLNILLFFQLVLLWCVPIITKENAEKPAPLVANNRYNPGIVIGIAFVLVMIWIYGFTRPDFGERGTPSQIYEYSIIFFVLAFYYCGNNNRLILLNVLILIAFALQNFVYGGRITGVQLIILAILCLYIDKLTVKKVAAIGIPVFILMNAIGMFRASIAYGFSLKTVLNSIQSKYFALDTAYSSYFTSMTFLDVLNFSSWDDRFYLFRQWVLSMFVGGSFVPDSNLAIYTREYYIHNFGGVLPYFAWFYLGGFGILLLGTYIRFLFNIVKKMNVLSSGLIRCLAIYICVTTMRWYLYSPSQLFRGIMLLIFSYGIAHIANEFMNKSKQKQDNTEL